MTNLDSSDRETIGIINTKTDGAFTNFESAPEGGTASSYIASNVQCNRKEFVKVYHTLGMKEESVYKEPQVLSNLNHKNIIKIYNVLNLKTDEIALFMKYLPDGSLSKLIKERKSLHQSINIIREILYGVSYLHQKRLIHKDLKPGNILLRPQNNYLTGVIADLGSVSVISEGENSVSTTSKHSYFYRPPEGYNKVFYYQSDLYQVGLVFYELINGPLDYALSEEAVEKLLKKGRKLIDTKKPVAYYTKKVDKVIKKATHPNYIKRYQSALEFIQAINNLQGSVPNWKFSKLDENKLVWDSGFCNGCFYRIYQTKNRVNYVFNFKRSKNNTSFVRYKKDLRLKHDEREKIHGILNNEFEEISCQK